MTGWELVVAALGGLLVGVGTGMVLGRNRELGVRRRLTEHVGSLRQSVIPVLEERADALGLPEGERCRDVDDPLELAGRLATSIRRHMESHDLPFSDTLEISGDTMKKVEEKVAEG